jgi:hypothetical protein
MSTEEMLVPGQSARTPTARRAGAALVCFIPEQASNQLVILDRKLIERTLQNLIFLPISSVIEGCGHSLGTNWAFGRAVQKVRPFLPIAGPRCRHRAHVDVRGQRDASAFVKIQACASSAVTSDRSQLIEPVAPRPVRRDAPGFGASESPKNRVFCCRLFCTRIPYPERPCAIFDFGKQTGLNHEGFFGRSFLAVHRGSA